MANGETTEAMLSAGEQVKGEVYHEGDRIKVYVVEVRRTARGTQVVISRTHHGLVRRLFEMEVPEIYRRRWWRSAPSPVRPAAAPRWPSGPTIPTWIPSAPAWAPAASA